MNDKHNETETLRQAIRVLEEENAQLSERAEDAMLLGLVSESIDKHTEPGEILNIVVERISILKNISYSTCARRFHRRLEPMATYAVFSNLEHSGYPIELTETALQEISDGPYIAPADQVITADFSDHSFKPQSAVLIPFSCRVIRNGVFLFLSDEPSLLRLSGMLFLLDQIVNLTLTRLDNQDLLQEMRTLTKNLEARVEERTQALVIANEQLKDEIRERKQAALALKNSNDRFMAVVDGIDAHVYVCNMENYQILFMNRKMKEDFGDCEGQLCYRAFHKESAPCSFCKHPELIDIKNQPGQSVIWEGYHPYTDRWYLNHDRLIYWDDNRLVKLQIASDITHIKNAEKAKQELSARLQESQKMHAVGTLAGGVAHDFNNLLMGVLGTTSLLLEEMTEEHPHYKSLKDIEGYVSSATNLTRQLLGFARKGKVETSVTNLNNVITESLELFGRTKKELSISTALQPDLWLVEADGGQIHQVLLNLYLNGWQAMPAGGELNISSSNRLLTEPEAGNLQVKEGKYITISVSDQGVGMDSSILPHIFDPFFTTKERERGTGLGLASSYGIIRSHGGAIEVNSQKGRGSTFTISLPATEKGIEESHQLKKAANPGSGSILLIDDELMIRDIGGKMLETLGYQVELADSGEQGLEKFQHSSPDLVILDMVMPGMKGLDVLDKLLGINPDVRIILSSGYSLEVQLDDTIKKNCAGFLQKPFTLSELAEILNKALQDDHRV